MQETMVIILVVVAASYSAWKLMPARRRLRAMLALDAWLARQDFLQAWRQGALARGIRTAAGSGCAGCAANTGVRRPPR